jgi:hypothetical protein
MSIRILALIVLLLIATGAFGSAYLQESTPNSKPKGEADSSTWPNLDRVTNPDGTHCELKGKPGRDKEKELQNLLRNRYRLPKDGFKNVMLEDLRDPLKLKQGRAVGREIDDFPKSDDDNHLKGVSFVAYVIDAKILSCGVVTVKKLKNGHQIVSTVPLLERQGVESANCNNADETLCTTQIFVTPDSTLPRDRGHNVYILNVTRRSRKLAEGGYLSSNIGHDWSTKALEELKGKWVRFSGWLFFNQNYLDAAWVSDPKNKIGKRNDRETSWSLFPVMGIEKDVPPPAPKN